MCGGTSSSVGCVRTINCSHSNLMEVTFKLKCDRQQKYQALQCERSRRPNSLSGILTRLPPPSRRPLTLSLTSVRLLHSLHLSPECWLSLSCQSSCTSCRPPSSSRPHAHTEQKHSTPVAVLARPQLPNTPSPSPLPHTEPRMCS